MFNCLLVFMIQGVFCKNWKDIQTNMLKVLNVVKVLQIIVKKSKMQLKVIQTNMLKVLNLAKILQTMFKYSKMKLYVLQIKLKKIQTILLKVQTILGVFSLCFSKID